MFYVQQGRDQRVAFQQHRCVFDLSPADLHGLATMRARRDPHDGDTPLSRINNVNPAFNAPQWLNRKTAAQTSEASEARTTSRRGRMVDPATCERDDSLAVLDFTEAIQAYKFSSGRMFPTWSEVLEVLGGLGYQKA
jgi:hypothetical protein